MAGFICRLDERPRFKLGKANSVEVPVHPPRSINPQIRSKPENQAYRLERSRQDCAVTVTADGGERETGRQKLGRPFGMISLWSQQAYEVHQGSQTGTAGNGFDQSFVSKARQRQWLATVENTTSVPIRGQP